MNNIIYSQGIFYHNSHNQRRPNQNGLKNISKYKLIDKIYISELFSL